MSKPEVTAFRMNIVILVVINFMAAIVLCVSDSSFFRTDGYSSNIYRITTNISGGLCVLNAMDKVLSMIVEKNFLFTYLFEIAIIAL
jgi:hypothetical protein